MDTVVPWSGVYRYKKVIWRSNGNYMMGNYIYNDDTYFRLHVSSLGQLRVSIVFVTQQLFWYLFCVAFVCGTHTEEDYSNIGKTLLCKHGHSHWWVICTRISNISYLLHMPWFKWMNVITWSYIFFFAAMCTVPCHMYCSFLSLRKWAI